jgi:hypothetical protein
MGAASAVCKNDQRTSAIVNRRPSMCGCSDGCGDKSSSDKLERKYRTGRVPKKTDDSESFQGERRATFALLLSSYLVDTLVHRSVHIDPAATSNATVFIRNVTYV